MIGVGRGVGSSVLILFAARVIRPASWGGGKAKPDGGNPQGCQNSLECPANTICDRSIAMCVDCVSAADCPENNDCTARHCVPFVPCASSLDCPTNQVCNTSAGRCVGCV